MPSKSSEKVEKVSLNVGDIIAALFLGKGAFMLIAGGFIGKGYMLIAGGGLLFVGLAIFILMMVEDTNRRAYNVAIKQENWR